MEFETKRALLEYMGKNPDDRKLVDRMIAKGKVYRSEGMYVLVDRGNLLDEVVKLREEIKELKNLKGEEHVVVQQQVVVNSGEVEKLKKELVDTKNNLTFQIGEYDRLSHRLEKSLRKCYDFMLEKKLFVQERNPFSSFVKWATDVDMTDMDEDLPF